MYTKQSKASIHVGKVCTGKTTWLSSNGFVYVGDRSNTLNISGCVYYKESTDEVALETQSLESPDCLSFRSVFPSASISEYED